MDSKSEKASVAGGRVDQSGFKDPKVTSIVSHLRKKNFSSPHLVKGGNHPASRKSSENQEQDLSVAYIKLLEHNLARDTQTSALDDIPPAILGTCQEPDCEQLDDLERRIIQKIQDELDPANEIGEKSAADSLRAEQHIAPDQIQIPGTGISDQEPKPEYREEEKSEVQGTAPGFLLPVAVSASDRQDITGLERWLDKTPEKEHLSGRWIIAGLCLLAAFMGIVLGGAAVAAYMNHIIDQKMQMEDAYRSYRMALAERVGSEGKAGKNTRDRSGGGNGVSNASALAFAVPASGKQEACEPEPVIRLTPVKGGRTKVEISSSCRKSQTVNILYGDLAFAKQLNEDGALAFVLDCFAGDKQPIVFTFADQLRLERKPVTDDLDQLTKIAVIWNGPVNIDLHAFEYMALTGGRGHIWERTPSDYDQAFRDTEKTGLGHGFLSSSADQTGHGSRVEVYTFINADRQRSGAVKLALDYRFEIQGVQKISCDDRDTVTIEYSTSVLVKNTDRSVSKAASVLNPCDLQVFGQGRLNARAVQDLVFER